MVRVALLSAMMLTACSKSEQTQTTATPSAPAPVTAPTTASSAPSTMSPEAACKHVTAIQVTEHAADPPMDPEMRKAGMQLCVGWYTGVSIVDPTAWACLSGCFSRATKSREWDACDDACNYRDDTSTGGLPAANSGPDAVCKRVATLPGATNPKNERTCRIAYHGVRAIDPAGWSCVEPCSTKAKTFADVLACEKACKVIVR